MISDLIKIKVIVQNRLTNLESRNAVPSCSTAQFNQSDMNDSRDLEDLNKIKEHKIIVQLKIALIIIHHMST